MQQAITPKLCSGMTKDKPLTKVLTNRQTRVMACLILLDVPRVPKFITFNLMAVHCIGEERRESG